MEKSLLKKIIFVLLIILFLIIIYLSRSIIQPVFLSLVLAYMLSPLVRVLTLRGVNKRLAVFITLTMLLGFMFIIIYYIIPGIIRDVVGILYNSEEYTNLIAKHIGNSGFDGMPSYLKGVVNNNIMKLQNMGLEYLNNFFTQLIDFTMELPTYILTPVFVYYFLDDSEHFTKLIKSFIPSGMRDKSVELWREIDKVLGSFIRSQLILSLVISGLTFVSMLILKVKYPIIIAFINGITNIIPYFGPIIGFVPAFLAAITQSLNKAILVAVAFFIIQQFESSVIAPKLIGDTMGIHPVFIMIIIILGGKYFGGWGLLLSVPAAGIVKVMFNYTVKNMY